MDRKSVFSNIDKEIELNKEVLFRLLLDMIRCHPIYESAGQIEVADLVFAKLESIGLKVRKESFEYERIKTSDHYVDVTQFGGEFKDYGTHTNYNIVAEYESNRPGPAIVLNGHLDVEFVTSPEKWIKPDLWLGEQYSDGNIMGRGASDMLGGVACFIYVIQTIISYLKFGSLTLHLVFDEEIGGNGTLDLLMKQKDKVDIAIVGEPTDNLVCFESLGFHQLAIHCTGQPVHMVFAKKEDNANYMVMSLSPLLEDLNSWIDEQQSYRLKNRFVMYGLLRGGSDSAVPANNAQVYVTLALPESVSFERCKHKLNQLIEEHFTRFESENPTIVDYGISFPGSTYSNKEWCEEIVTLASETSKADLSTGVFSSPCDARLYEAFGIPSIVFGPGSLKRAHAPNEFVTSDELLEYCEVLSKLIVSKMS